MAAGLRISAPSRCFVVSAQRAGNIAALASSTITDAGTVPEGLEALSVGDAAAAVKRSKVWVELLFIAWLLWLYDMLANLAPLRRAAALRHAWSILHIEQALAIDPELAMNHWLATQHALALGLSDYYDNAHFIVTLGLLGWIWWRRPRDYRSLRNILVLLNLIGFAVFWLYPMAPPRMLVAAGFKDIVASTHAFGSWHTGSLASEADQYAAMPSLHMAWAAWVAIAVWRITRRRWMRALGLLHVVLTGVTVLATGNHFVIDVLAGLATAVLSAWLVIKVIGEGPVSRALMRSSPSLVAGLSGLPVHALEAAAAASGARTYASGASLGGASLGGASPGGASPGGASPDGASFSGAAGAQAPSADDGTSQPEAAAVSHVTNLLRSPRQGTLAGRQPQMDSQVKQESRRERAGGPSHL